MKIYHGHPSPKSIQRAREAAPNHTHGAEWSPMKMTPKSWPYILDNGAFHAYTSGHPWDSTGFVKRLLEIRERMPRDPDFVVLPDVVTNPDETFKRSRVWADLLSRMDLPMALALQDGMKPGHVAKFIAENEIEVLFLGGTTEWKRKNAESFRNTAHQFDLHFHIGRPSDLKWALEIGADSVDTTSIVQNGTFYKLEELEEQATLNGNGRCVDTGGNRE